MTSATHTRLVLLQLQSLSRRFSVLVSYTKAGVIRLHRVRTAGPLDIPYFSFVLKNRESLCIWGGRLGVVSSSFHLRRYARARGKGGGGVAKQLTGVPFSEVKLSLLLNLERQSSFLGT